MATRPRSISGNPGGRIRLILGATGYDYLYFFNEDDGNTTFQTKDWNTADCGGLPDALINQLNKMSKKGMQMKDVAFRPDNEWILNGVNKDGSGSTWWCGNCSHCEDKFRKHFGSEQRILLRFGPNCTWLLVKGNSSYRYGGNLDNDLLKTLAEIKKRDGSIHQVQLFPSGGYFIKFDRGLLWKGVGKNLDDELKKFKPQEVEDVCKASDGSWVILRQHQFHASKSVSDILTKALSEFYRRQRNRQSNRAREIMFYNRNLRREEERLSKKDAMRARQEDERSSKQQERISAKRRSAEEIAQVEGKKRLEAEEKARMEEKKRLEAEEKARMEEKKRLEAEEKARMEEQKRIKVDKKREREKEVIQEREREDYRELVHKRFKVGERVTVTNLSDQLGDSIIISHKLDQGKVKIKRVGDGRSFTINDLSQIVPFHDNEVYFTATMRLLIFSVDKYEAAMSLNDCECGAHGVCFCKHVFSASVPYYAETGNERGSKHLVDIPPQMRKVNLQPQTVGPPIRVRPLLEHRGEILPFDEYKCAEKINVIALGRILEDLQWDSLERDKLSSKLEHIPKRSKAQDEAVRQLQRCAALQITAQTLYDILKHLPPDEDGCVVHQVEYEHKDATFRGRLFARGQAVRVENDKPPRTATIQGMPSDLRTPLIGAFSHDIDCENSGIRLICSLAAQLGIKDRIPTLVDYKHNRPKWLKIIATCHGVSKSEAKRLVNIIASGGRYETWLRANGIDNAPPSSHSEDKGSLKNFVFNMYNEIQLVRDEVLSHPRFKWTSIHRKKLIEEEGKNEAVADMILLSHIVNCCENEVLGVIHRCFAQQQWVVRAKVFDGLIAEPSCRSAPLLPHVMRLAEVACLQYGWDVKLAEKDLHGLQNQPVKTILEARNRMKALSGHQD